jgi:phosphonate transport system substrate-binding protein
MISGKRIFLTLLPFVVIIGAAAAFIYIRDVKGPEEESARRHHAVLVKMMQQLTELTPLTLDSKFTDANHNLVADAPQPNQCIDPAELTFSYVATENPERYQDIFRPLVEHLSQATGKPVKFIPWKSTDEEVAAMQADKLTIAGFNTGGVSLAVNKAGFIPVCMLPSPGGAMQMEILVPADSPIKTPADLKGHELTLTEPSSNSGFKAPMVILKDQFGLQPGIDYVIRISGGHDQSLEGLVSNNPDEQLEAIAVANDMLNRHLADGTVKATQFRSIYKSTNYPTACFGYVYNLKPDLAKKIHDALLDFDFKDTAIAVDVAPNSDTKFIPCSYKNDWAIIRDDDNKIIKMGEDVGTEATTQPASGS